MARTTMCPYGCGRTGLYSKTGMNGEKYLYDPIMARAHFLDCPNQVERREEFFRKRRESPSSGSSVPPVQSIPPVIRTEQADPHKSESEKPILSGTEAQVQEIVESYLRTGRIALSQGSIQFIIDQAKRAATDSAADVASQISEKTAREVTQSVRKVAEDTVLACVQEIVREELDKLAPRQIEVKFPNGEARKIGRQHKNFPILLQLASLREHVLMVGPAGSGKTTAAEKVAEALNLPFYLQPMGPSVTESRLLGWIDASGKLVRTLFRDAYENGGVFMADEMDNCNASALTTLNGALANGHCGFPDGMVKCHPDFIFLGGANTWGHGADRMYVGRQQLDAATLDRFANLEWDYDDSFELELAGNAQWVLYVQRVRRIVFEHKLRVLVTPRASIKGAKLLAAGIPRETVERVLIWAGMPGDAISTIKTNLR